jgi:hypothetical protein
MKDEIQSHVDHGSHEVVPRPADATVLEGIWKYRRKEPSDTGDGEDVKAGRAKSRYCARGDQQEFYLETNSPTLRIETLKLLLSEIALKGWDADQLDIKTAFLNADIDREIYIEAPRGFGFGPDVVWRLRKAIYGLKQANRLFFKLESTFAIEELDFKQCDKDRCLFVKFTEGEDGTEQTTLMAVSTDDILLTGDNAEERAKVKRGIMERFETHDLGQLKSYLGMEITREGKTLKLSQRRYLDKLLKKYNCENIKRAATPMEEKPSEAPTNRQ